MFEERLYETNAFWEYILTTYGYCPKPAHLREERLYHAIFQPTFHRACFLSLSISPPDAEAILTFGYLAHARALKGYREIISALRSKQELPALTEAESVYLGAVQMVAIPLQAWQAFEQQMQVLQPFKLGTLKPYAARDGIIARGIVTNRHRIQRFDVWSVPPLSEQRAFFLEFISVGCANLEKAEQEHLKAIQRYL